MLTSGLNTYKHACVCTNVPFLPHVSFINPDSLQAWLVNCTVLIFELTLSELIGHFISSPLLSLYVLGGLTYPYAESAPRGVAGSTALQERPTLLLISMFSGPRFVEFWQRSVSARFPLTTPVPSVALDGLPDAPTSHRTGFQFELMGSRRQELELACLKSIGTQSTTHRDALTQAQAAGCSETSKKLRMRSCALVCVYVRKKNPISFSLPP